MIETTLALSIAVGVLAAAAVITAVGMTYDKIHWWYVGVKARKEEEKNKKPEMVKRFQYLAGITNSYEDEGGYLRRRFNRIRSTAYNSDYNCRFNKMY